MRGLNKVMLIGHLGKDPDIKTFETGNIKASFALATTESYKDKAGVKQEKTEWHNIVTWNSLAQIAQKYLRKGMAVYVEGKIQTRSYDDKDGVKKYITEIFADNFQMLDRRDNANSNPTTDSGVTNTAAPTVVNTSTPSDTMEDDLPF